MNRIPNVFAASDPSGNVDLSQFNDTIVLRLQLPAGRYAVFGKVTVRNVSEAQDASARLTTRDGAELVDQTNVRLGHSEGLFHNTFFDAAACVTTQGEVRVESDAGIVDLRCATFDGAANGASLIALDVGDAGLSIDRSTGVALRSFADTVVARLRLGRARYVVIGKAALVNLDGAPQDATFSLTTKDGATVLASMRTRLERNGDGHAQSLDAQCVLDASDGDFVDLRCTTFNGSANDVVLTALAISDAMAGDPVNDEPDGHGGFAARRLAAMAGHQIVFAAVTLPNLDDDNQRVTARLTAGPGASKVDETFVDIVSRGAGLLSLQGVVQDAAAGERLELDWAGFINGDLFHTAPRDASLVAIGADRVNHTASARFPGPAAQGRVVIQSNFGRQGNFEMVVPLGSRLAHFFRDNDAPGRPWHGPFVFFDSSAKSSGDGQVEAIPTAPTAVSLLQSNFVTPGNLELVVRLSPTIGEDRLVFFYRDATGWHGPFDIAPDGQSLTGVTGF